MSTQTPSRRAWLASVNPATGEVVGEVPITAPEEVSAVLARARRAFPEWRSLTPDARAARLVEAGEALLARAEEMGRLLSQEMGKPLPEAVGEVLGCAKGMPHVVAEIAEALRPESREDGRTVSTIHRDPFGVCAVITPWNFPVGMPHWLVVPALVAGNTVVLKPSEKTPLVAEAYARTLAAALPPDVLQVVHGDDVQGKALVAGAVDLVAFTGSREAGKAILAQAASALKRVILELGGKDPLLVLDDADVDAAAAFAVRNGFRNAGQVCVSTERVYVDASIAPAFLDRMATLTAALRVGGPDEADVDVGPMVDAAQRDIVLGQLEEAVRAGARVVAGGSGHHDNVVMPTVLTDVPRDARILQEETFGPVVCVVSVESEAEAVSLANDSPFALGAVVFGRDVARASSVARRLDAGMIGINRGCGGASGSPWVGAKESGYGFHSSVEGHRQFTQTRVVSRPAGES